MISIPAESIEQPVTIGESSINQLTTVLPHLPARLKRVILAPAPVEIRTPHNTERVAVKQQLLTIEN